MTALLDIFSILDHNKFYQNESFPSFPDFDSQQELEYENSIKDPFSDHQSFNFSNINNINNIINPDPINPFTQNEEENFLGKKRLETKAQLEGKKESKETKESTGENPKINKKIKFETKSKLIRNDYYIKKFKVNCFSDYFTQKLNRLLQDCKFPQKLNIPKIYSPNNKAFTSDANLERNRQFLSVPIKVVFSMKKYKANDKVENAERFDVIFNSRQYAKNMQAYTALVNCLNLTVEDVIKEYYDSEAFEKFRTDQAIKEYDAAFKKEKKFSLLEDYGFLKLIKAQY